MAFVPCLVTMVSLLVGTGHCRPPSDSGEGGGTTKPPSDFVLGSANTWPTSASGGDQSLPFGSSLTGSHTAAADLGLTLGSLPLGSLGGGGIPASAGTLPPFDFGVPKSNSPPQDGGSHHQPLGQLPPSLSTSSLFKSLGNGFSLGSLNLGGQQTGNGSLSSGSQNLPGFPSLPLGTMLSNGARGGGGGGNNRSEGTSPGGSSNVWNPDQLGLASAETGQDLRNSTGNASRAGSAHPDLSRLLLPEGGSKLLNGLPNSNGSGSVLGHGPQGFQWWVDDLDVPAGGEGDGDGSCGRECSLNGGRCVFDFNQTYSQVCVYDSVSPCHKLTCLHGNCTSRNGSYSCACDEGWTGIFCNKECGLDCGEHGSCVLMGGSLACHCHHNYTGSRCQELKPEPEPWEGQDHSGRVRVWQVAAGCLGAGALVLLSLLLLGYVTWRGQWLPIRRFVHYFQHYEDDDGKEYDAFVSYRSASRDEQFVLHELHPMLERQLDFRLCMHFRDFPPGETIADNIIQAIENSRRTILVLSAAYVESEWCRLEYQKAQHEMLKLRHKIIPVLLEDLEGARNVDRNLKTILDTVTYIRWPGSKDSKQVDKFWKLLQLSMPKRKSDYSRSLSSTGSCSSDRPLTSVSPSCFSHVVSSLSEGEGVDGGKGGDVGGEGGKVLQPQRSLSLTSSMEEEVRRAEERERKGGEEEEDRGTQAKEAVEWSRDGGGDGSGPRFGPDDKCYEHLTRSHRDCCDTGNGDSGGTQERKGPDDGSAGGDPSFPNYNEKPQGASSTDDAEARHVTSDDHIVQIREVSESKVKVTPWVPASRSMTTSC